MSGGSYTPGELMVAAAAREISDGEVVFVGMRLPLLAFIVAKNTHAPTAVGYFECGLVRETAPEVMLYTMADSPNQTGADWAGSMTSLMGLLASGHVDLGFVGGAQIDRRGNLNTSFIGDVRCPAIRLPGSGGAADFASLAQRLVVIMPHERRRFVERVDYITSPGYGDGGTWREDVGLPGGGPQAVITTLGVVRFDASGDAYLDTYHPFSSVEEIRRETGWDLALGPDLRETPPPSEAELGVLRRYDSGGFWTRKERL